MANTTILVAVEDELLLRTISWFLKEHGYAVLEAQSADRIFEYFAGAVPDLFLLDVTAPSLPGPRLLEWLKADDPWRDMPVLILTAMPPEDDTVRMLGVGAADFIGKPFRVRELLARIQVQLRIQQMLREAREELRTARAELRRVRSEVESQRELVGILHEVTGDLSPDEIYHLLVRRVARALDITHCSLILAGPGDETGFVATAYENPTLRNLEIRLARYPEIRAALESGEAVLIEDVGTDPLYADVRTAWLAEGMDVRIRSVIALPFTLDRRQAGVFFLRTSREELPLSREDVEFADTVIKAAVTAIRKAELLETTRADKARLEQLASTDSLTQTLNRRALMDRLTQELDRAARYEHSLVLLMIDLDHFKLVNDNHGHLVGDDVLRRVAQILLREVRTVDIVARYGGEEFVVVLPEQQLEGATAFAERVRQRVAEAPLVQEAGGRDPQSLTISIGLAAFPSLDVSTVEDLIARADEALYRAKASGRNRVFP
ncbi:MAG: diguanylate cyclase [Gemmatimonadota bacterium]|nr:diguanylate cyclase [Gemmatimonadota bacterium]